MHTANNVIAPAAFARPRPPMPAPFAPPARRDRRYDIHAITEKLGLETCVLRTAIDNIRQLVDRNGFPQPVTVRLCQGVRVFGGKAVTRRSLWDAEAVDHWLDRDLPPPVVLARDNRQRDRSHLAMADRAQALVG